MSEATGQLSHHDISHVGISPVFARRGLRRILGCLAVGRDSRVSTSGCGDDRALVLLLAAGFWARLRGQGLLGWRLDGQFLLQFVALQEAKLDAEFQDCFLLLMDGLVQVCVFVLRCDKNTAGALKPSSSLTVFTEKISIL